MTDADAERRVDRVRDGYDIASYAYRGDGDLPGEYLGWLRRLDALLAPSSVVADLGCGCGVPVAQHLDAVGHRVVGVDVSAVQIERARRLVPDARFVCDDLNAVSFDDGSLNAVVCLYAIIHLPLEQQPGLVDRKSTRLNSSHRH